MTGRWGQKERTRQRGYNERKERKKQIIKRRNVTKYKETMIEKRGNKQSEIVNERRKVEQ